MKHISKFFNVVLLLVSLLSHPARAAQLSSPPPSGSNPTGNTGTAAELLGSAEPYPMSSAQSNNTLWSASAVVDGNPNTLYSSNYFPTASNNNGTFLAAWLTARQTVYTVGLQARMANGKPAGFPLSYQIYLTNSTNSAWSFYGTQTIQPDSSGLALFHLKVPQATYGVMVIPITLGTDPNNNHYFQMAELQLYPAFQPILPKYFGYYSSDNGISNYAHETQGYTNTLWIGGDLDLVLPRLQQAKALGMKAMLDVGSVYFSTSYILDSDYAAKWAAYAPQIAPYVNDGTIAAFYPIDEPYGAAYAGQITYGAMLNQLQTVGASIKGTFPNAKIAMLFTIDNFSTLAQTNIIPQNFDWISFDCYGSWDACGKVGSQHPIPWYVQQVEARLYPGQKTMLIPDTAVYGPCSNPTGWDASWMNAINARLQQYWNLATSDPKIVGVFGFLYSTFEQSNGSCWIGTQDPSFEPVLNTMKKIGLNYKSAPAVAAVRVPNLYAIKQIDTGTNSTEVHELTSASGFSAFNLHTGTSLAQNNNGTFEYQMIDWDHDGIPDLAIVIKSGTGSGTTEVHVLSGASNYQQFIVHSTTALGPSGPSDHFQFVNYPGSSQPSLALIKTANTGSNSVEVHVLSGDSGFKTFLQHSGSAFPLNNPNFTYLLADYDGDGYPDLIGVLKGSTGTGKVEVHILGASSRYQNFELHIGTMVPQAGDYQFQMVDWNGDGQLDLAIVQATGTASGEPTITVLDSESSFQFPLFQGSANIYGAPGMMRYLFQ